MIHPSKHIRDKFPNLQDKKRLEGALINKGTITAVNRDSKWTGKKKQAIKSIEKYVRSIRLIYRTFSGIDGVRIC